MYKVLVVDDKEAFRRKIKRMAYFQNNREKFEICCEAQNGMEALELLHQTHIDIVLTDIRMPLMDGIQLLKQINAGELCNCVILLSEFAEFNYAKEGILNRAFDYILKPIDEEKISGSFDRAYTYLNSFAITDPTSERKEIHALAESIFTNKASQIKVCITHIVEHIQHASAEEDIPQLLQTVFTQLKTELLGKWAFLEYYISFDYFLRTSLAHFTSSTFADITTEQLETLATEICAFSPILAAKNERVRSVCIQMLFSPDENLNIQVLANQIFVNSKYLSAMMKKDIGLTAVEFVTFIKTQRAKFFLSNTEMPISEIALILGYQEINYFSRVFKKATSLSPREFRRAFGNHGYTKL
ncbi:MAG: response regulator transcription factor [Oscillospiraceae bacterium]